MNSVRHRGLYLRRDRPYGDGNGVLARDTLLDGVCLPAGTEIVRDEDFDFVMATLVEPLCVRGVDLPVGTVLSLYRANPKSFLDRVMIGLILVPLGACYVVVIGGVELVTGAWKPWRREPASRPAVEIIAWLPGDEVPQRSNRFHEDGTITRSSGTSTS